jgi:hypothetical protein
MNEELRAKRKDGASKSGMDRKDLKKEIEVITD